MLLPKVPSRILNGEFSSNIFIQPSAALLLLILFLLSTPALAREKYSNVKIYLPKDPAQRLDLISLLEIDHFHEDEDGAFNYTVDESEMKILRASKFKYEVVNEDAIAYLEEKNKEYYQSVKNGKPVNSRVAFEQTGGLVDSIIKTPSAFVVQPTFGGYYSYAQMVDAIDTLVSRYPTLVQKFSIGNSVEGRAMWCVKISDNPTVDEAEPEILFMGLHHAREAISGSSMVFTMQYLCENYTADTRIRNLVDNREIFIIVCTNPDGWEWNRTLLPGGGGQWRKNRRVNSPGYFGVDLNRNWGVDFANCTGALGGAAGVAACGSASDTSEVYWGPSQYSEPETRNLRAFVRSRDFGAVMDQHSVGPYYSLPWGRVTNIMSVPDSMVYLQMASVMGKYNGMRQGSTYQTLGYEVSGGMKDVLLRGADSLPNGKCYGMTGEGSNGTSATTFWPIAADIIPLCKGMMYQNLQLIYTVGSYVDLQDKGSLNLSSRNGKFYFEVRRIGLESQPVTVSVVPLQNITSVGSPITIAAASLPNFNSTYQDSISYVLPTSIAAGNSIKFAWKIETGGYTYYDTVTNIFQAIVVFSDNMEGALATSNWTLTPSSGAWAYTNDAAYKGTKSLAESPAAANYGPNVNLTAQKTTTMNLSGAGVAFLSFWVKYRSENFRDFLRVEVSTNGTTWIALTGKNTVRKSGTADGNRLADSSALTGMNDNWSREVFDLKDFLGATTLRLRFRFNSNANSTLFRFSQDKGFNIDELTVITGGTPSLLPLELTTFTGRNEDTKNNLYWSTASEINSSHFVLERSVSGVDFTPVGNVMAAGNSHTIRNYTFTDENPYTGENLYRLKMVDTDGSYEYSKLVSLKVEDTDAGLFPAGIEKMYPNPATGNMYIRFNVAEQQATFQYTVYNSFGQIVHQEDRTMNQGQHTIDLDVSNFAQGAYIISFYNPAKGITYENRFIKI